MILVRCDKCNRTYAYDDRGHTDRLCPDCNKGPFDRWYSTVSTADGLIPDGGNDRPEDGEDHVEGQPPEEENNPWDLKKKRRYFRFKLRDDVQAWWEGTFITTFETVLGAGVAWALYDYVGVPFEAVVILMLAYIGAQVSAIWRCYVR